MDKKAVTQQLLAVYKETDRLASMVKLTKLINEYGQETLSDLFKQYYKSCRSKKKFLKEHNLEKRVEK